MVLRCLGIKLHRKKWLRLRFKYYTLYIPWVEFSGILIILKALTVFDLRIRLTFFFIKHSDLLNFSLHITFHYTGTLDYNEILVIKYAFRGYRV